MVSKQPLSLGTSFYAFSTQTRQVRNCQNACGASFDHIFSFAKLELPRLTPCAVQYAGGEDLQSIQVRLASFFSKGFQQRACLGVAAPHLLVAEHML